MMGLKVAILGARGIGKYHAREYHKAGCEVVSILGTSKESSEQTSAMLERDFGIKTKPYWDLTEMLDSEKPDAVSICTPPETHETLTRKCLERKVNVLCEKPFIVGEDIVQRTLDLLHLAYDNQIVLTVNTQWPSILPILKGKGVFREIVKELEIYMEPGVKGREMLVDHLPHANSMLIRLAEGRTTGLKFQERKEDEIVIVFDYGPCKTKYHFRHNPNRPRAVEFTFNGRKVKRRVGENYQQSFECEKIPISINDPLMVSIRRFVDATPLIKDYEILESAKLTDLVLSEYDKT